MQARTTEALPIFLTEGMARRLGLRFASAILQGILTPADLRDLLDRCRACGRPELCLGYLAELPGAPELPPAECANAATLLELARFDAGCPDDGRLPEMP